MMYFAVACYLFVGLLHFMAELPEVAKEHYGARLMQFFAVLLGWPLMLVVHYWVEI